MYKIHTNPNTYIILYYIKGLLYMHEQGQSAEAIEQNINSLV